MNTARLIELKAQSALLNKLLPEYRGKTIDNIIQQIESQIKWIESN